MADPDLRTNAIVMATLIGTVLVALSTSLPMYDVEMTITRDTVDYTYHVYYYLDYVDRSDGEPTGFSYREELRDTMWVVKVFVYIWVMFAVIFAGLCLLDAKFLSIAGGLSVIGVSIFTLVYFTAKMGADGGTGLGRPGAGFIFLLVAFVLQMLAVLARSWHTIPGVVEEFRKA